jgi:HlyD family secretion protein
MKKRTKLWVGCLGALFLAGTGLWAMTRDRAADEVCLVARVTQKDVLREKVTGTGEIQALTKANIGVQVTASIKEVHVKDGQWVKVGDVLVTLDQEQYRQGLNQSTLGHGLAKKDLQNAETTFKKQEQTYQRYEALLKQGLVSAEDFQQTKLLRDTASTTFERAIVAVRQAEAQVALSEDALSKTVIKAPMSGQITGLRAEKGETAIAGQTNLTGAVLMVISDMSEMLAEVKVGELEIIKLKAGQSAEITVDALPGKVFPGTVVAVAKGSDAPLGQASNVSAVAQNFRVRVQIKGDKAILATLCPGMSARVAILTEERKDVLAVPLVAVQDKDMKIDGGLGLMQGTRSIAYVVKDGKAEARPMRMGLVDRQHAQVLEGLVEGEWVITGPPKALTAMTDGKAVKTKAEGADGKKK